MTLAGHGNAQRHAHFAHALTQLGGGGFNQFVQRFGSPGLQGGQLGLGQRQGLGGDAAQVLLGGGFVDGLVLFEQVTALGGDFHQGIAALGQQGHHSRQGRALAGIDLLVCHVPGQVLGHIGRIQAAHVVVVQPQQFVGVEGRGGLGDGIQAEQLDHLLQGEDLLIAVGPAQAHQVVQQGFRQVAVVTVLHDGDSTVALGELGTVVPQDHGDVGKLRHWRIQGLVDVDLARGVVDVVFAAHHVGDLHVPVVHHHAEVVGGGAVGAADDEIVELGVGELDAATHVVIEHHGAFGRVAETDDVGGVGRVIVITMAALAVVTGLLAVGHLAFAQRFQALLGAVALVGAAIRQHLIDQAVVAIETLGLVVGALIPVQLQPFHTLDDGVDRLLGGTFQIGILDTQHELTALILCKQPGIECGTGTADMQEAGRAGSKTGFDFHL